MEVRDQVRAGTTTIIVATGGVEQNGPYVSVGKHNYVLSTVLPYIARAIGDTHRADCSVRARGLHRAGRRSYGVRWND